jgi:hypothetical protein
MELKTPGRKEGRGEGEAAYYEKKKAQEDRNLTFEQRITEICHTVRVSLAGILSFETNLSRCPRLPRPISWTESSCSPSSWPPRLLGRYVCYFSFRCGLLTAAQTKEDNRKNNAQKQESINRGKAAAKTHNAVVLTMPLDH